MFTQQRILIFILIFAILSCDDEGQAQLKDNQIQRLLTFDSAKNWVYVSRRENNTLVDLADCRISDVLRLSLSDDSDTILFEELDVAPYCDPVSLDTLIIPADTLITDEDTVITPQDTLVTVDSLIQSGVVIPVTLENGVTLFRDTLQFIGTIDTTTKIVEFITSQNLRLSFSEFQNDTIEVQIEEVFQFLLE